MDARFIHEKEKKVITVGMSSPWIDNCTQEDEEKITKYGSLRWELKEKCFRYALKQHIITIDVLGGWLSGEVELSMRELFGDREGEILGQMQEAIVSS